MKDLHLKFNSSKPYLTAEVKHMPGDVQTLVTNLLGAFDVTFQSMVEIVTDKLPDFVKQISEVCEKA